MYINSPFDSLSPMNLKRLIRQVEEKTRREFEARLPNLLPLLPDRAWSLTHRDWELLYYVLYNRRHAVGTYKDDAAVLAVLQTLQQQADKIRLPCPTFWAGTVAFLWASEEGSIAEAAEVCLPLLQA